MHKKRVLAAALAAAMACTAALTGCSRGAGGPEGSTDGADSSPAAEAGDTPGKGRFMEEEIELPEEMRENGIEDVTSLPDGSLEFLVRSEGGNARIYRYDGSGWTEAREVPAPEGVKASKLLYGEDGAPYYGGFDMDYAFHLWTQEEDGEVNERFSDVFAVPEGEDYGLIPDFVGILPDQSLLVSDISEAVLYHTDGRRGYVLLQDFLGTDTRISAAVSGTDYYTLYNQEIVRYDLLTGKQSGSFPMPGKEAADLYSWGLFTDGDFLYAAGVSGLYRIGLEGTMWEQLIDGSLNSMGRRDIYLKKFAKGAGGEFYGIYTNYDKAHLFRYDFDETADAAPTETLTIYALRDHATVRQAAAVFQKENPGIRVDYRIAVEDPQEAVSEDVIRALNTELVNGGGADVLILDGLPAEIYKNKGLLADLSGPLADIRGSLLPNMLSNYLDEEGKCYYLPARMIVPVIFGSRAGCEAMTSLDKMESYEGDTPLFAPDLYENLLRFTAYTCYEEIFEPSGSIREGMLLRWLTAVKSAGGRGQAKTFFNESERNSLYVDNRVFVNGFARQCDYNLALGRSSAGAELLRSLEDVMIPFAAVELLSCEVPVSGLKKTFVPSVMAGINASSGNQEAAGAFLRVLFGDEVQREPLGDGFAVRTDSLESWGDMEKDISTSTSMRDSDVRLNGEWPKRQEREDIIGIVRLASVPAVVDESILQIVADGSRAYFEGTESAEQAAAAIGNKLQLMFSERE